MNNIVLWVAVAVLAVGAVLIVAAPLLRAGERIGRARRASYDLAVFRDQLAEVDRDLEAGRMNAAEASAARTEIERRMLRAVDGAADQALADAAETASAKSGPAFPIAAGVVVVGVAVAVYLNIGKPDAPDMPLAFRTDQAVAGSAESANQGQAELARLEGRVRSHPDDANAWAALGRSRLALGQHAEANKAFLKSIELSGDNTPPELLADYGEGLTMEAFSTVTPRAKEAFNKALEKDPTNIRARFYIAMGRAQAGDYRGAIALWRGLSADAPPDAPWLEAVRQGISDAAMRGNIMPISVPPERPAGAPAQQPPQPAAPGVGSSGLSGAIAGGAQPTQEEMAAARQMAPDDQQAFIRSMVQRLADKMEQNPEDIDGWLRLGRAYKVLGDNEEAKRAFGRAKDRLVDMLDNLPEDSPTRPSVQATLAEVEQMMAE